MFRFRSGPRSVIAALTEVINASKIGVPSVRQSVMRQMIRSCVQAYFGSHADEVVAGGDAPSTNSMAVPPMSVAHR